MKRKIEGISICIPTYNRLELLKVTLDSIYKLKELKKVTYEILISDDSDNNLTANHIKTIKNKNIRYFKNKKKGQFNSLNNLIKKSKYEWILFIHDDDFFDSEYIRYISPYIHPNSNVDLIWTGRQFVDTNGVKIHDFLAKESANSKSIFISHGEFEKNILSLGYQKKISVAMMITGLLVQKQLVVDVGGFDSNLTVNADGLFLNKLQFLSKKGLFINMPLIKYRISLNSERGKPSEDGVIYQEMRKIMQMTLKFVKNKITSEKYKCFNNEYKMNFYSSTISSNGSLLWTALRFKGSYRKRVLIQLSIVKDVFAHYPHVLLNFSTLAILLISLLPQIILTRLYAIYLKIL